MSYEPTNWKDGDLVTSAKLNKIEQGIAAGGGVLIVHEDEGGTLDKTWQEIYDADACIIQGSTEFTKGFDLVTSIAHYPVGSQPFGIKTLSEITYIASSPDDYPTLQVSGEDDNSNLPLT